jgi:hypothetical protein
MTFQFFVLAEDGGRSVPGQAHGRLESLNKYQLIRQLWAGVVFGYILPVGSAGDAGVDLAHDRADDPQ